LKGVPPLIGLILFVAAKVDMVEFIATFLKSEIVELSCGTLPLADAGCRLFCVKFCCVAFIGDMVIVLILVDYLPILSFSLRLNGVGLSGSSSMPDSIDYTFSLSILLSLTLAWLSLLEALL